MRRIVLGIILLLLTFFSVQAQTLPKHVEYVSEVQDTMILISHHDADVINTAFYNYSKLDSLNKINTDLISLLNGEIKELNQITVEQEKIIANDKDIYKALQEHNQQLKEQYDADIKRANRKVVF